MTDHTDAKLTGRCLCGACRFTLTGPANWVGHCHCDSCRRATASAYTTWIGQPNGGWTFTEGRPQNYASSPGQTRGFCPTCGTQLFYKSDRHPDEVHFYAALLDQPGAVAPTTHYHRGEALPWAHPDPNLPDA